MRGPSCRRGPSLRQLLLAAMLALLGGLELAAADPSGHPAPGEQRIGPFTLTVRSLLSQVRVGGPCWVEIGLAASDRLRTGRLTLEVRDHRALVGQLTCHEWALSTSLRREVVVLPPLAIDRYRDDLHLHLSWTDDLGTSDLEEHLLTLAGTTTRQLVVGLCLDGTSDDRSWQRLILDRCAPPEATEGRAVLRTAVNRLSASDLPDAGLAYAALDALLLTQEAVAALKPAQSGAIAAWVRGGGMLALLADEVAASTFPGMGLPPPASDGHRRARVGLGRVVVAPRGDGADGVAWRASTAFLWRVRADRSDQLIAKGVWSAKDLIEANPDLGRGGGKAEHPGFHRGGDPAVAGLLTRQLWPQSMHIVPLEVIIAIFVVFVLLVGPIDWWVLGLLRRRRWTWVTFPATALAVTAFTIGLSRHYLGSHDEMRVLTIIDLDEAGEVARTNRLELHIAGEATELVSELDGELLGVTAGDHQGQGYRQQRSDIFSGQMQDGAAPQMAGSVTGRSRSGIHLAQWSPTLVRRLRLGGQAPAFPWPASLDGWGLAEVRTLARDGTGVALLRQGAPVWVGLPAAVNVPGMQAAPPGHLVLIEPGAGSWENFPDWIRAISRCDGLGWSSLTAGGAPLGGFPFDDLPLWDASDGGSALMVVVKATGEGFQMLRRPYRVAPPPGDGTGNQNTTKGSPP